MYKSFVHDDHSTQVNGCCSAFEGGSKTRPETNEDNVPQAGHTQAQEGSKKDNNGNKEKGNEFISKHGKKWVDHTCQTVLNKLEEDTG
jgi:hypothetical protein